MKRYEIVASRKFEKELELCRRRGFDMQKFAEVIDLLGEYGTLPDRYRPHKLSGNFSGYWECHIKPDWLLIWKKEESILTLTLVRTGTHSDLF